ncbi:heterokaryon incompatibility protein-domain-containing protein [Hyaloscypha finlandica]|nr:heterokaryon incompatibility protein-domain-containing protein [Hyaloscypha finlandica]
MASHETVGRLICPGYENLGIPTLYVHDLTGSKDADRLLSKPPLIHPATPNILPKLRRWNPEVASAFSEKDNAVKRIPFKLVTKNRIWSPIKTNSFQAVSYCWHNNQWTVPARFGETPEDWPLPMSPAMLRALLCCTKDGEAVWIDQLCIDQNDSKQKAHAIANMDTIYRNASRVLILLEDLDISPDVERSLHLLASTPTELENITSEGMYVSRTAFAENFSTCFAQGTTTNLFNFSADVFNCRWFTRAWCCQEYQLNAERIFIYVGCKYRCVALNSRFFMDFHYESAQASGETHDLYTHPEFQKFSFGIGLNEPDEITQFSLFLLFVELEELSCFYLRDLVSITLNMSGLFLSFNKDITCRSDCQFILALILLSAGDPMVLDSVGPPIYKLSAPGHQGVIRWPIGDDFRYWTLPRHRLNSNPGFGPIRQDSMTLDVFFLRSQPRIPGKESIEVANACWAASQTPRSDFTDVGVATLASALDLGLSWVAQNVHDFLKEMKTLKETSRESSMDSTDGSLFSANATGPEVIQEADHMKNMIQGLLVHFRHVERNIPFVTHLNKEGTRHAILFVPSRLGQHVRSSTVQFLFAVPTALNNLESSCLRRLWILEKSKTSESVLSIVGQGYYFGDELRVDSEVSFAKDINVVGRWNDDEDSYDSAEEWANDLSDVPDLFMGWV